MLGLVGIGLILLASPMVLVLAVMGVGESKPWLAAAGALGFFGIIAWWVRLFSRFEALQHQPLFRRILASGLAGGTAAAFFAGFGAFESAPIPVFLALGTVGAVMWLGTVELSTGPNNSSKPTPLRGAA